MLSSVTQIDDPRWTYWGKHTHTHTPPHTPTPPLPPPPSPHTHTTNVTMFSYNLWKFYNKHPHFGALYVWNSKFCHSSLAPIPGSCFLMVVPIHISCCILHYNKKSLYMRQRAAWTYPPQFFTSVHLFNKIIRSRFTISSPLFKNNWVKIHHRENKVRWRFTKLSYLF